MPCSIYSAPRNTFRSGRPSFSPKPRLAVPLRRSTGGRSGTRIAPAAPWWLALPCTLLIKSLGQYAFHLFSHKQPVLWRLHRVHHCDVHLDVSSALRTHPFEMIASSAFAIPIVVICGLPPVVLAAYE